MLCEKKFNSLKKTNHGYSKKKYWNSLLKIQNYSQQQTHLWNDDTNKNLKIERKKFKSHHDSHKI